MTDLLAKKETTAGNPSRAEIERVLAWMRESLERLSDVEKGTRQMKELLDVTAGYESALSKVDQETHALIDVATELGLSRERTEQVTRELHSTTLATHFEVVARFTMQVRDIAKTIQRVIRTVTPEAIPSLPVTAFAIVRVLEPFAKLAQELEHPRLMDDPGDTIPDDRQVVVVGKKRVYQKDFRRLRALVTMLAPQVPLWPQDAMTPVHADMMVKCWLSDKELLDVAVGAPPKDPVVGLRELAITAMARDRGRIRSVLQAHYGALVAEMFEHACFVADKGP